MAVLARLSASAHLIHRKLAWFTRGTGRATRHAIPAAGRAMLAAMIVSAFLIIGSPRAAASENPVVVSFLQPSVASYSCKQPTIYQNKVDMYMPSHGTKDCITILWQGDSLIPYRYDTGLLCSFYAMNPDHSGRFVGTKNAYYSYDINVNAGTFSSERTGITRIFPTPTNRWQLIDTDKYYPANGVHFEVADNNGATSGTIGVGQIKMVCY